MQVWFPSLGRLRGLIGGSRPGICVAAPWNLDDGGEGEDRDNARADPLNPP
jgi:hypothetical protein